MEGWLYLYPLLLTYHRVIIILPSLFLHYGKLLSGRVNAKFILGLLRCKIVRRGWGSTSSIFKNINRAEFQYNKINDYAG